MVDGRDTPSKVVILKSARNWLRELLDTLPDPPLAEAQEFRRSEDTIEQRPFNPDRDSAAEAIMWAEQLCEQAQEWEAEGGGEFPVGEAFKWMHETVGLNLYEIERRFKEKEFDPVIVPRHVSGTEQAHRLYSYLTQVRLAYMIGADLAAIALCRSTTELLIRYHYASHVPNARISSGKGRTTLTGTNPPGLIERAENRYNFLRNFHLGKKVCEANRILHGSIIGEIDEGIRSILIEWVRVLKEMIDQAPPGPVPTP